MLYGPRQYLMPSSILSKLSLLNEQRCPSLADDVACGVGSSSQQNYGEVVMRRFSGFEVLFLFFSALLTSSCAHVLQPRSGGQVPMHNALAADCGTYTICSPDPALGCHEFPKQCPVE